jgi:hypothetical protein
MITLITKQSAENAMPKPHIGTAEPYKTLKNIGEVYDLNKIA